MAKEKILVVDDEEDILDALAEGGDLGGIDGDLMLHEPAADARQQARAVRGDHFQYAAAVGVVLAQRDARRDAEMLELARRVARDGAMIVAAIVLVRVGNDGDGADTGDGDDYKQEIQALASLLRHYASPVETLDDLKNTKNVALVMLQAELPAGGAREGDRLDVVLDNAR